MTCPFLEKTPQEIRNKIYTYLLYTEYTKRPICDDEANLLYDKSDTIPQLVQRLLRVKRNLGCSHFYDFQPAILLTNRQINEEARRFLYDDNLFVLVKYTYSDPLDILWALSRRDLALVAIQKDDIWSYRSALRVSFHVGLHTKKNDDPRVESQFVIAANELPMFCRQLRGLDNQWLGFLPRLKLVLEVLPSTQLHVGSLVNMRPSNRVSWNPRSLPQQRKLLEPFATLHSTTNLKIADVDGKTQCIDAQLMEDVREKAGRPPYSMGEILDAAAQMKERGNEAFRAGDFALAHSLYESASSNLVAVKRYLTTKFRDTETVEEAQSYAYSLLAFRISSNSIAALLRLQQWTAAHKKATIWIGHVQFPTVDIVLHPNEMAKILYRRALASEGRGNMTRAVEEIREALCHNPSNMLMKAKKKEWKLQVKTNQAQAALKALTM